MRRHWICWRRAAQRTIVVVVIEFVSEDEVVRKKRLLEAGFKASEYNMLCAPWSRREVKNWLWCWWYLKEGMGLLVFAEFHPICLELQLRDARQT